MIFILLDYYLTVEGLRIDFVVFGNKKLLKKAIKLYRRFFKSGIK